MNNINSTAWLEVDLDKMAHNIREIKRNIGSHTEICAVIKADAYKLGVIKSAETYIQNGASMVAVAVIDEAMEIRRQFPGMPILVLGHTPAELYETAVKHQITMTLYDYQSGVWLNQVSQKMNKIAKVHIKIETGMNRLGFLPNEQNLKDIQTLSQMLHLEIKGVYSHLANADEQDKTACYQQKRRFDAFVDMLSRAGVPTQLRHISNSAAVIDLPDFNYEMVRPGIILTGLYPSTSANNAKFDLKMVFKLKAKITHLKSVNEGEGVSYGHRYITNKKTMIATIPIGYADGFSRFLTGKMEVAVKGIRCKIIGSICMDQCMVDVTEVDHVSVGDEVILYDDGSLNGLHPDEVAARIGTINHEILTMLDRRLPRIYYQNGEIVAVKNYLI